MQERIGIYDVLPGKIRFLVEKERLQEDLLQEIRLRTGQPLILIYRDREVFPMQDGKPYRVQEEDLKETLEYVSNYSLYAYEQEMRQGFITMEGGHRVGMTGQAIMEKGQIKNLKYISSLNIRVSHEKPGCADQVLPYLIRDQSVCHTLLVSPPRCGKTTLLRDLIRQVSDGRNCQPLRVAVADERGEVAGLYHGRPQLDVGARTDVLEGCPKAQGLMLLLRAMNPQVLAADEITDPQDVAALRTAVGCGAVLLATAHGTVKEDLERRALYRTLLEEGLFRRLVRIRRENGRRYYHIEELE